MKQTRSKATQTPGKVINDVMLAIDALRDIYVQENDLLERADAKGFMNLQDEKTEHINVYRDRIEALMQRRDEARQADPLLKKKLQAKQEEFAGLCEINLKNLKKMQRGTERLGDKIRFCVQEATRQQGRHSYGETGSINASSLDKPLSIGVSETA